MKIGHGRGWVEWFAAVRVWMYALIAVGILPAMLGQSGTDGAIGGRVVDAGGTSLRGATVVARDVETGLVVRTVSGGHGEFLVVRLPVGEYEVTAGLATAKAISAQRVAVELGNVTEIELWVDVAVGQQGPVSAGEVAGGEVAESEAEAIAGGNDAGGDGQASFRGEDVAQNSAGLDDGSGDEGFSGRRAGGGVTVDGDTGADEVYDGAAGVGSGTRSVAVGGQRTGSYAFSQLGVREFRIQGQTGAAGYGAALYGHGVGGVVTSVSRSGGTTLHGMAFYTVRNSAWAAVNPFSIATRYADGVVTSALVKPKDVRQQFGGRVGGPVFRGRNAGSEARRRLFYFYAFDEQRRDFPAISAPGFAGFYSLTTMQSALLANRGVTRAKTEAALNYLGSLTGTVARSAVQTVNFGRLDWQSGGGSRLVLEYNRGRWSGPGAARSGAVVDRGVASMGSSYGRVDAGVARWVQMLKRGWSNEVRAQVLRELLYETAQSPLAQEPNIGPGEMPPEVSIGPQGLVFGTPATLGQRAYPDERRWEIADVLAWVHGRQLVQLGGDFSALRDETDSLTNVNGTFSYDSGVTNGKAGGLVDWITDYTFNVNAYPNGGCPSINAAIHYFCFRSYSQSFGEQSLSFNTQEWAGFVQDDWRVSPRLTVHAGVRYEYEFLPLPQRPNAALDAVFGARGATSVYPEDRNNFGPRLGVEWSPLGAGRGVVRVGYGVYFGKLPGATIRTALMETALPSSVTRVRILPTTVTACPQKTTVGFGYPCAYLAAPGGAVGATTSAVVFDRGFRMPMVQQGTLSVERELGGGVLGIARYNWNSDRQLSNSVDINIAPATGAKEFQLQGGTGAAGVRDGEMFAVPMYTARVSPSFGPVTALVSNANAGYDGLTLEARRNGSGRERLGSELGFNVAWTWSKAIDFGQNPGATPRANGQLDPFNVRYDKGMSALNFPHRVVATIVWSPRIFGGRSATAERAVWKLLDNWSLAGMFTEASGRGYSFDIFGGTRLTGGRESINGSGGSAVLPTVGRNTLRLPDRVNLNARLSRDFRLGEKLRLRCNVEAFNVTNHVNYSGVTQRAFLVGTPVNGVTPLVFQDAKTVAAEGLNALPFGTHTEAGTNQSRERQVEMGLRVEF